jgi:hypothetical protein
MRKIIDANESTRNKRRHWTERIINNENDDNSIKHK